MSGGSRSSPGRGTYSGTGHRHKRGARVGEGRLRRRHSSTVGGRKPPVGHLIGPARGRIGRIRVHGVPRTAKRFHALDAQRLKRHAGWIGLQSERHPLQIHGRATCNRLQQRLSAATPGRHVSAQGEGGEGLERGMIGARGRVWGRSDPRPVMTGSAVAQAMVEGTGWSRRQRQRRGRGGHDVGGHTLAAGAAGLASAVPTFFVICYLALLARRSSVPFKVSFWPEVPTQFRSSVDSL